jgi:hypothetical protein
MLVKEKKNISFVNAPTIRRLQPRCSTLKWEHSPIIMAMLTGNTMRSCAEAEALLSECSISHSDDRICQAAARRIALCMKHDEQLYGDASRRLESALRHEA